MKLDPRIKYYTSKEMRELALATIPEGMAVNSRRIANEFARRNGFEKTRITISGVKRVYFYKKDQNFFLYNATENKPKHSKR